MKKRAALYIRVSSQEQAMHGLSLDAQKTALEKYASAHNYEVVNLYADEGISARKLASKRKALQELLADIENKKIDVVLFIKLDRWFRNISEYYKVQDILDRNHVDWIATQEDYETTTASGRLKVNIMLSVAQDEADRTSERIKFIVQSKKEKNEPFTGHVPKGYKIVNKQMVVDEELRPIVARLFSTFLETGSIHKASEAVKELGLKYHGISDMLRNKAYMGNWKGIICEPYITESQYNRIQELRKRGVRNVKTNRTYIFSGLLVCGECGRRLGTHSRPYKGSEIKTYYCKEHEVYGDCDNRSYIAENKIEDYILRNLESEYVSFSARKKSPKNYIKFNAEIMAKLDRLNEIYIDGNISKEQYEKRRKNLQGQLKPVPKEEKGITFEFDGDWKNLYKQLSEENKQIFWKTKIQEIRLYKDRRFEIDFL